MSTKKKIINEWYNSILLKDLEDKLGKDYIKLTITFPGGPPVPLIFKKAELEDSASLHIKKYINFLQINMGYYTEIKDIKLIYKRPYRSELNEVTFAQMTAATKFLKEHSEYNSTSSSYSLIEYINSILLSLSNQLIVYTDMYNRLYIIILHNRNLAKFSVESMNDENIKCVFYRIVARGGGGVAAHYDIENINNTIILKIENPTDGEKQTEIAAADAERRAAAAAAEAEAEVATLGGSSLRNKKSSKTNKRKNKRKIKIVKPANKKTKRKVVVVKSTNKKAKRKLKKPINKKIKKK